MDERERSELLFPQYQAHQLNVRVVVVAVGRTAHRYTTRKRTVKEVLQAVLDEVVVLDDEFWTTQISEGAVDLLKRLLDRDPSRRLTAFEALEHPWVKHAGTAPQALPLTPTLTLTLTLTQARL